MTDAIAVFPPGFRVTDNATGAPVSGAKIKFYAAGTTTPKTVYSDSALSTSLGTIVYTDSLGTPVASFGSSTAVMVYVGTAAYKAIITDADDATLRTLDNIEGAINTSAFLTTGSTSTLTQPVITKTANFTIGASERSKLIEANATGGQFTLTLTAAATLGDNWSCKVRNAGSANPVILTASEAIAFEGGSFTARALDIGEAMEIICDGTAFKIAGHIAPLMASKGPAVIPIVDLVTSAPVAPTPGQRWIVSGAFSTYSVGDIIEANGTTFNKYTPPANSGWLAYVQSLSALFQYQATAWVALVASTEQAQAGSNNVAFMTALAVRNALPARGYAEYTAITTLSTVIPFDDTIPQNTEGTQILSVTITPKSVASRIRVRFHGTGCITPSAAYAIAALFQDSTANALVATASQGNSGVNSTVFALAFEHVPALAVATTYNLRVGASSGNLGMNSSAVATRAFGGVSRATLIVEELLN